jgi:hypothetical protein
VVCGGCARTEHFTFGATPIWRQKLDELSSDHIRSGSGCHVESENSVTGCRAKSSPNVLSQWTLPLRGTDDRYDAAANTKAAPISFAPSSVNPKVSSIPGGTPKMRTNRPVCGDVIVFHSVTESSEYPSSVPGFGLFGDASEDAHDKSSRARCAASSVVSDCVDDPTIRPAPSISSILSFEPMRAFISVIVRSLSGVATSG